MTADECHFEVYGRVVEILKFDASPVVTTKHEMIKNSVRKKKRLIEIFFERLCGLTSYNLIEKLGHFSYADAVLKN